MEIDIANIQAFQVKQNPRDVIDCGNESNELYIMKDNIKSLRVQATSFAILITLFIIGAVLLIVIVMVVGSALGWLLRVIWAMIIGDPVTPSFEWLFTWQDFWNMFAGFFVVNQIFLVLVFVYLGFMFLIFTISYIIIYQVKSRRHRYYCQLGTYLEA